MLEQAVYAGRNHAFSLAAALTLLASAPAQAADVTHVRLGSAIDALIAGPDGGAWVRVARAHDVALGRAFPDGRFLSVRSEALPNLGSALGPDREAWFPSGVHSFARMDAAGRVTTVAFDGPALDFELAAGPDATLWALTTDDSIAHVTPQGAATFTPTQFPACGERPMPTTMAHASDGAVWVADPVCDRLVRISPAGAWSSIALPRVSPDALAADASGGMWFAGHESVGHVDASGHVRRVPLAGGASGVTVTPDGSAWFALGSCRLGRITAGGPLTSVPVSIPATQVASDPSGGLWPASRARLRHVAAGAPASGCDDRPPAIRVSTRKRVPLSVLR